MQSNGRINCTIPSSPSSPLYPSSPSSHSPSVSTDSDNESDKYNDIVASAQLPVKNDPMDIFFYIILCLGFQPVSFHVPEFSHEGVYHILFPDRNFILELSVSPLYVYHNIGLNAFSLKFVNLDGKPKSMDFLGYTKNGISVNTRKALIRELNRVICAIVK